MAWRSPVIIKVENWMNAAKKVPIASYRSFSALGPTKPSTSAPYEKAVVMFPRKRVLAGAATPADIAIIPPMNIRILSSVVAKVNNFLNGTFLTVLGGDLGFGALTWVRGGGLD